MKRLCVLSALAALLAGCGSGNPSSSGSASRAATASATSTSTSASSTQSARHARHHARPRGARIGTTQRVHAGGATLSVTVTRVLDPLSPSEAALLPRTRGVGVMVTIHNDAGATYDSTASGDWSLLSTAGLATPLSVRGGPCQTQLVDFESLIYAGDTRTGCVAFTVSRGAKIVQIRFSPHSRAPGRVAWR